MIRMAKLAKRFSTLKKQANSNNFKILLEHINTETGEIHTLEGTFHGLEDGDQIVLEDFEQAQLNNLPPMTIKTANSNGKYSVQL
jgi:hypothetical protein